VLTRELATYDRWTATEIRDRGHLLAKEAARIWTGPKERAVRRELEPSDEEEAPSRQELRRRFWSGLSDYLAADHPDLPAFEARPNWTIRLASGIRHIGIELRLGLRHNDVGIDVWFWSGASLPVWERIRLSPKAYNELVNAHWEFEQVEDRARGSMFLNQPASDLRNESSWPAVYGWLGEKLSLVYERVMPKLREEMDRGETASPAG
jgi:hypothetical protein